MQPWAYEVDTSVGMQYVYPGDDSVIVYAPRDSGRVTLGIFKHRGVDRYDRDVLARPIALELRQGRPFVRLASAEYDTTTFADRYCPVIYPLTESSAWYYRPDKDLNAEVPIVLRCRGLDTVSVPAGVFSAWKLEWDWSLTILDGAVNAAYDWVTHFGYVRRYWDVGSMPYNARDGRVVGVYHYDIFEYCGDNREVIPALEPLLPREAIDSALASAWPRWDFDSYRLWYAALTHFCDTVTSYCSACDTTWGYVPGSELAEAVWGDTLRSFAEINSYLDTAPFPSSIDSLDNPRHFLRAIVDSDEYMQGWSDCDFDWRAPASPVQQGAECPYGQSVTHLEIAGALYDRFD